MDGLSFGEFDRVSAISRCRKSRTFQGDSEGFIGCDYQRVKQFVCHNCDRIGVFCDKHCDGIERFLEGSSSEALEYLG